MSDLEPSEVGLRRAARERALELLYEAEAKGLDVDAVLAELPLAPAPLAVELVRGVAAERDRIDELLARRVAPRWTMVRLASVDRAILRLATYELIGAPDRSQAVILNEAVVLARRFGTDDSPRFVNGVLSAVANDVRGSAAADPAGPAAADAGPRPTGASGDADPGPAHGDAAGSGPTGAAAVADAGAVPGDPVEGDPRGAAGVADAGAMPGDAARGGSIGARGAADPGSAQGDAAGGGMAPGDTAAGGPSGWAEGQAPSAAAVPERTVDAVVIDLDGVIRHWDNEALPESEQELGLPPGTILGAAFEPGRMARAMRGELPADQWYAEIGDAVAAEYPVEPDVVAAVFSQIGWRIDESVVELVEQARAQVPVVLLSNASSRLADDLKLSGLLDRFDAVVGSADLGACKPDAEAFAAAVERTGVPAARCLMIDDLPENVEGARAAGLQAVRFEGVDELTRDLEAVGVLPPPD